MRRAMTWVYCEPKSRMTTRECPAMTRYQAVFSRSVATPAGRSSDSSRNLSLPKETGGLPGCGGSSDSHPARKRPVVPRRQSRIVFMGFGWKLRAQVVECRARSWFHSGGAQRGCQIVVALVEVVMGLKSQFMRGGN